MTRTFLVLLCAQASKTKSELVYMIMFKSLQNKLAVILQMSKKDESIPSKFSNLSNSSFVNRPTFDLYERFLICHLCG